MARGKKTQSITIKDVPSEYAELFSIMAADFHSGVQKHTAPEVYDAMPRGEKRTLYFCEVVHQEYNKRCGFGAAEEWIDRHRFFRDTEEDTPAAE